MIDALGMDSPTNNPSAGLFELLGPIDHSTGLQYIRERLASRSLHTRRRLILRIEESLLKSPRWASERDRVLLAKVVTALLPDSVQLLERLLLGRDNERFAEFQFSLFVALSDLPGVVKVERDVQQVLDLVELYLLGVRSGTAQAPWMAGDMLGDHWPLGAALPTLERVARRARFVAGREGAIHGLSHALTRASKRQQWVIMQLLLDVSERDRSSRVRRYARSVMGRPAGDLVIVD